MTFIEYGLYSYHPLTEGASGGVLVGGVGAAPAPVPRKHGPGRPWVTVRPHYGGPPFNGLDGTGRAGRKLRARAGEEPAVQVPEATVPEPKIAAVERRKATRLTFQARGP